jgi:hypothetical protein
MRASVWIAAVGALAVTGCAASPAPHPIVAAAPPATSADESRLQSERRTEGTEDSGHAERQTNRALGWAAISIGADAGVVAVVTSFMMLHENSIRSDNCVNKQCNSSGIAANDELHQLALWNATAWVVGAVGLGAGLVLVLTNPSDKQLHAEVAATPSGFLLRGAF